MPDRAAVQELTMDGNRSAAEQMGRLAQKVETLSRDVEAMEIKLDRLVAAWAAADSLVTLVKWAAGITVATVALYAAAKQWFLAR